MFPADTLSQAFPVSETVRDDPEMLNIVHNISKHLPMSEKRRVQFKKETELDPELQIVVKYIKEANSKEPLKPHTVPYRPFEKIGVDIMDLGNTSYLIVIDYYSKWIEVAEIVDKSADEKENEELLRDVKEKNIAVKEKEEINVCHEKQSQSQKKEFDSELKKKELQQKESETDSLRNKAKEKEYQFDELRQMIDASLKQLDWTNIRRAFQANQTRWKLSPPSATWWGGFWERLSGILKEKT
ncbi:transposon Tf2-6 polyprotein [Trichonephila clavipes]|nr:transposon Tf2-6 polyprotein [Trichonephila clavipes]